MAFLVEWSLTLSTVDTGNTSSVRTVLETLLGLPKKEENHD